MTEESISVEIKDGVDSGISRKLKTIADDARAAHTNVEKLVSQLDRIKPSALNSINRATSNAQKQFQQAAISAQKLATETQRTQAAIARTDTAINRLIASDARAKTATDKLTAAKQKLGETEEAQAARIKNTVAASLEQVKAREAEFAASQSLDGSTQAHTKNIAAETNAINERFAALQREEKLVGERKALNEEVNRLLAVGIKSTDDLAKAEQALDRAMAKGALSTEEQAKALANIDKQAAKIKPVTAEVENLGRAGARTNQNFVSLFTNLAQGQWSAARANVVGLAQSTGFLSTAAAGLTGALGALLAGFVGIAAILALVGFAVLANRKEFDAYNKALIATGNVSGTTAGALAVMSSEIGRATGEFGKADTAIMAFVNSGLVAESQLRIVAETAVNVAKLTGKDIKEAAKELEGVFDDPIKGAVELNGKYRFLTVEVFNHIRALEKQGDKQGAATALIEEFGRVSSARIKEAEEQTYGLARAWGAVGNAIAGAWDRFKQVSSVLTGAAGQVEELSLLREQMARFDQSSAIVKAITPQALIDSRRKRIEELTVSVDASAKAAKEAGAAQRTQDAAIAATQSLDDRYTASSKLLQKQAELKTVQQELTAAFVAGNSGYQMDSNGKFIDPKSLAILAAVEEKYKDTAKASNAAAKAEERREVSLAKINAQLDNEIKRMTMLGPERNAQAEFDKISESLIQKRIKLTGEEEAAIKGKIKALEEARVLQGAIDQLYENSVGPLRDFNATLDAANKLVNEGVISWQEFYGETARAADVYKTATDPLYQFNKELDEQLTLLKLLPKQREIEQQVMQAVNNAIAGGKQLREDEIADLREKLTLVQQLNIQAGIQASMMANSNAQQSMNRQDETQAAIGLTKNPAANFTNEDAVAQLAGDNPALMATQEFAQSQIASYTDMYAQIDTLRQADVISETSAITAKMALFQQQYQTQIQGAMTALGALASLQNSENKKQAAIGKKAAIAQTLIATYQSATSAFSSMAGIPYVGPILGAVAAAAAIAAGMANIQKIKSQNVGFQNGGYTGNLPTSSIAGPVHGQEYVFDAPATSRIGVGNLEALRRGRIPVEALGRGQSEAREMASSAPVRAGNSEVNYNQTVNVSVAGKRDRRTGEQEARAIRRESTRELIRSGG